LAYRSLDIGVETPRSILTESNLLKTFQLVFFLILRTRSAADFRQCTFTNGKKKLDVYNYTPETKLPENYGQGHGRETAPERPRSKNLHSDGDGMGPVFWDSHLCKIIP